MTDSKRRPDTAAAATPSGEAATANLIDGLTADKALEATQFAEEYAYTPAAARRATARRGITFPELADEYHGLWAEMAIRRDKLAEVDATVARIVTHKDTYRAVERLTAVPWYAIAVIHSLEAGGDFNCHLHNGDPLTARTVHVPAGRPAAGNPPFNWEQSAVDALEYDDLTTVTDWSMAHLAYLLENFNGWGYRKYHPEVKSPYLWSYSNHYTSGKYVGDGQWSPTATSRQCGAMVLLKRLQENGEIQLDRGLDEAVVSPRDVAQILDDSATTGSFPRELGVLAEDSGERAVSTQLTDGTGIFGYYPASKRYGTAATIAALRETGRIWNLRHASPRVGVGDISLRGGGDIDGHASHETGRDVDMRPMRGDGTEGPVTWQQATYSRSLTQELIDILYANGVVEVKVIGFNDPGVQGCVNWVNHDNHLHVRFYFADESPGYPLLQVGLLNSPPVRECQRRLNNWRQSHGSAELLAPDGDFGQKTAQAVVAFQTEMGLTVDGKVGRETWLRTLNHIVA